MTSPGFDVQRLLQLWSDLPAHNAAAEAAMREVYSDPVVINGTPTAIVDLVGRARSMAAALDPVSREVIECLEFGDKVVVAFRLQGTHSGTLATSAGVLPASGKDLSIRIIDILTLQDGLITEIVMVADELGALSAVGAAALVSVGH